ncbi:mitochondrial ATP synthase epsilon chain-domain-containing protein [Fomitopsis serialis]|uniref:mitochondrial ATP synthase epsilon chain-domain-containing protein n=1 Tax=Fomitopsis serialis TaxID=139415 RepID=UPI0020076FB8|nr:mitochondrial ATP synthase epsilon chain-domain-containing protein [Neoantrodia serialis]KAH9930667.1 mitochondrial ATP synthase epsilon chain-domain-containing protein [Neoantrodia serialis]
MSSATWRNVFTYNKYTQIAARAVRQSLKESERVQAEKRGLTALKYQHWENGVGGQQTSLFKPVEKEIKQGVV